jgi:sec-independent protein translocase protein TatA
MSRQQRAAVARTEGVSTMHMMGPFQLILVAVVVLVLFGRGKVAGLMGEVGKGISAFKKGVAEGKDEFDKEAAAVARDVTPTATTTTTDDAPKA